MFIKSRSTLQYIVHAVHSTYGRIVTFEDAYDIREAYRRGRLQKDAQRLAIIGDGGVETFVIERRTDGAEPGERA